VVLRSFLVALAVTAALTPLVGLLARRVGLVAPPRPDRWHRKPTALLGGVAIWVGFVVAYLAHRDPRVAGGGLLVTCASAMFVLGLIDDIFHLKPYAKLIGQIAAATALSAFTLHLPWTSSLVLNKALTVFWLVALTNSVNLLDNIDGLASGVAVIAAAFMTLFFLMTGHVGAACMSAALAGAGLGFLVYNFHPASVFMGDCGSLFLGYFLGAAALLQTTYRSRSVLAVIAPPLLVMAVPILDTTLVTLARKIRGRPVSAGGRDHTSHRLVALGLSERTATLVLWAVAVASGLGATIAFKYPESLTMGLVPILVIVLVFFGVYLGRVKIYQDVPDAAAASGRALIPTLIDFTYKRRVFEVLLDFVLIVLAYYGGFLLRFEGHLIEPHWSKFTQSLPLVIVVQEATLLATGLYRGLWQYTSIRDLWRFVVSTLLGVVLSVAAIWLVFGSLQGFSRSAFIVDWMILLFGIAASRVAFRLARSWLPVAHGDGATRVLVYGAGDGGELLLRELQNNPSLGLVAVGFIDDDPHKAARVIHGVPVLGSSARLGELLTEQKVEQLVISTAAIDEQRLADVTALCRARDVQCRHAHFRLE
jgi:UDP-GlcNAc:undecaprenyl-phosphate/decaprenyl-phosphate GlcNAc-1-phosphate transferase